MIVGVPNHHDLNETATGWLNLAWDITIQEAETFQEIEFMFQEIEDKTKAEEAIAQHWRAKRLKLNNAISLLQQSLEIFMKGKIAEVSPFLLIAGDDESTFRIFELSTRRTSVEQPESYLLRFPISSCSSTHG
jgi:NAD-specific glutamate dehydrogenase